VATQGSGAVTTAPLVAADRRCTPCVRCQDHLNNPVGCVAQAKSKVTVCMPCQGARKSCSWSMAGKAAESLTVARSGTEAGRAAVPKQAARRRQQSKVNTSPKGASKCKKARNTTEEDKADEEEVFGVPQAMAEEQHNALGMLTQMLVQLTEQMGALEAREQEQMVIERERLELEREHLELERRHTAMEERQMAEMDQIVVMWRQFVQGSLMGTTQKEIAAVEQEEENGADGDDEEGMADAEGEED